MSRQRRPTECAPRNAKPCGELAEISSADPEIALDVSTVCKILAEQGAIALLDEQWRFVEHLQRSLRHRHIMPRRWARLDDDDDIIALINRARNTGVIAEAIWRCFLAAHFGRPSASGRQIHSASRFLCAFRQEPFWTWTRVNTDPSALRKWLHECEDDLQTLAFGNHRKYESKQPSKLWAVIESFLAIAESYGGLPGLIATGGHGTGDDADDFDVLYLRLAGLDRFGRTGCFDFLVLLFDLRLMSAQPRSCYLRGATGPLKGAQRLWGQRDTTELDRLAAELSELLSVSPVAVEDALCNWQK